LQLPYTLEWNTSVQQALGKSQALTISYIGSSGRRLLQTALFNVQAFNSHFGNIYYPRSGITSSYQALQTQFQRSVGPGLHALASYTWAHSIDFGSNSAIYPVVRGNSDFDVRSNFSAGVSWDLPDAARGAWGVLLNHWGLDGRVASRTAFPITLNGSSKTDSTGAQYYSGVNLSSGQPLYLYGGSYPGGKVLNPAAFSTPTGSAVGNAPRNFVRGFGLQQINLTARREFHLYENLSLQFRAETFNVLNHPNFGYVNPTLSNAQFGQATKMLNQSLGTLGSQYQQGGPRSMQFALKLMF
jgi:hypothetical protein